MRAVSRDDVLRPLATQVGLPFLSREEFPSALPVMEKRELTTLREDGWAKAAGGVTTVEELLRVTQEDG
jgi:hypothetical protein